ncbi:6-bladed beta-propeller [Candidatus Poribacteria bacterium]|nr:6-bladed beta-propeller [Candidatus Poribacteria bacterium]
MSGRKMRKSAIIFVLAATIGGCAARPRQVDLVWPPAPEIPRIRYVRSISTLPDLERSGWTHFKDVMFGAEASETLIKPYGVAVDSRGTLYVSDTGFGLVFVFNLATKGGAEKLSLIGMKKPGQLARPIGLAVDAHDNLYVSDALGKRVVVYGPDHEFLAAIGQEGGMERPAGIAVDNARQRLYVVDVSTHSVKVYALDGRFLFSFGARGMEDGQFNFPTNVAVDKSGNIFVVDSMNNRVAIFDSEGRFVRKFGEAGAVSGSFARPKGIALDSDGHVYVVDAAFDNVQIFSHDGQILLSFGEFGSGPGEFQLPAGICIDKQDAVFVTDQYNKRIQVFQYIKETAGDSAPPVPNESHERQAEVGQGAK